MRKQQAEFFRRGNKIVLPIIGHVVADVRLGLYAMPVLWFSKSSEQPSAELDIWTSVVTLARAGHEDVLRYDEKPHPRELLLPFAHLLGSTVKDAFAAPTGELSIEMTDGAGLTVIPEMWEAWQFKGSSLSLIGDDGRLIRAQAPVHRGPTRT